MLTRSVPDFPGTRAFLEVHSDQRKAGMVFLCFALAADLQAEVNARRARLVETMGDTPQAGDRAVEETLDVSRGCQSYVTYRMGFTPREHLERRERELDRAAANEEARRRMEYEERRYIEAVQRENERDERARREQQRRDQEAAEREEARANRAEIAERERRVIADLREEARDRRARDLEESRDARFEAAEEKREGKADKRHMQELVMFGLVVSGATLLGSIVGAMIDAGWIVPPPWW